MSRMTVSLALRDIPSIRLSTRRRIRAIADLMGYQPDPETARLMAAVRAKKQRAVASKIAYLTAYRDRSDWLLESTQQLYWEGARQRARDCGYELEEHWLGAEGMNARRLSKIIYHRGIEGVIVAPVPDPEPVFEGFCWDYSAAVQLGYSLARPALNRACNHQFQSMLLLYQSLHDCGYQRIGLAMASEQDERVNHHWRAAYAAGQSLWSIASDYPAPLISPRWSKRVFGKWMQEECPDCVITVGRDVMRWLRELGVRTPEDMGLAHVDLAPDMAGVTGIDQHSRRVGAAALDLVVSQINHHERGLPAVPRITMVEGTFVQGATTRGIPRLAALEKNSSKGISAGEDNHVGLA